MGVKRLTLAPLRGKAIASYSGIKKLHVREIASCRIRQDFLFFLERRRQKDLRGIIVWCSFIRMMASDNILGVQGVALHLTDSLEIFRINVSVL